ncbi:universal stress protein [Streptomyces monticola]|uniref:Universal stress protein n=1 Tax=Streptomyces monticola TaxID=2666263 RepID=A0ABW2JTL0_9ACTN
MGSLPVVAAVDGTTESNRALEWAVTAARLRGTALRIVHIRQEAAAERLEVTWLDDPSTAAADPVMERVRTALADRADLPPLQYVSLHGSAADTLPRLGARARLLVLGSRGRDGFAGLLRGSNGVLCARESACPVVVVPRPDPAAMLVPHRPRVVLGLPAPSYDTSTVAFAFEKAARRGATLQVICAYPWSTPHFAQYGELTATGVDDRTLEEQYTRLAELQLAEQRRRYPDVPVEIVIAPGDPAGHLIAASRCADLVVVGRHRSRVRPGRLLGSVTNSLLLKASCPVAVVPSDLESVPAYAVGARAA